MTGAPAIVDHREKGPHSGLANPTAHTSALLGGYRGLIHGITKRVPSLGLADGNVGYSPPRDREDAWNMRSAWVRSARLDPDAIVTAHQTHGNGVLVVHADDAGRGARPGSPPAGLADALVTNEQGVVLLTLHADCMPVLLFDPIHRVTATIHAGWRGTVANVCGATLSTMSERFGTRMADVVAYLGPAIGFCCYEVGDDVRDAWIETDLDPSLRAISRREDRWSLDLAVANRIALEKAGVLSNCIEASGICTKCQGDEWFSHRGQGPETGRYGAFVALAESCETEVARD
jgi:YfiH family protein